MITLYYKDNVSDKVYQVSVDPAEGGYNVNFAYGRRGSTLNTGTKNSAPLSQETAEKMADKLVREKMAKGYTPGENGAAYTNTSKEDRFTGILPMLLNAIPEEEIGIFVRDDDWILQAKYDGKRMMVRKQGSVVEAINRKGLLIGAPQGVLDEIADIPGDFILDGECVGDIYYAFDVVKPEMMLGRRLSELRELVSSCRGNFVILAAWYTGRSSKEYYAGAMKNSGREGVVFKSITGFYTPGRPSTGGIALKHKFTATANVRVNWINLQRSVEINLEDGTPCGNVAIPANKDVPSVGDIIEVRYLYAMPNSNALYQPFYSRLRDDIDVADGVDALKYKKEED